MLIPESEIAEHLRFTNPWWRTGAIDPLYERLPRRAYFPRFQTAVARTTPRRTVILLGPRRVGKTVMVHHAISALIAGGTDPRRILHLAVDTPTFTGRSLEQLLRLGMRVVDYEPESFEPFFVFLDEIQYVRDWERELKTLTDTFTAVEFVATGSAAAALRAKSTESGAGRFSTFALPPLTFAEFIDLREETRGLFEIGEGDVFAKAEDAERQRSEWVDYLHFGGYPEVLFDEGLRQNPGQYIRRDIVERVLTRDLPQLYGITDVRELNQFFTVLCYQTGQEVSPQVLSKQSDGIRKETIGRYLEYLEAAFLLRVLDKVDLSARRLLRRTRYKCYLTVPSLRTALFAPLPPDRDGFGHLNETGVLSQWAPAGDDGLAYASWPAGEVDLVGRDPLSQKAAWATEIKWSNRYYEKPSDLKPLRKFCLEQGLRRAVCTTVNKSGTAYTAGIEVTFLPNASYAYTIGYNAATENQRLRWLSTK